MIEISTQFYLLPNALVREALILDQSIVPDPSCRRFFALGCIVFDQTPSETDAGFTWNQTFRAVTADPAAFAYNGARIHPAFVMSDGSIRVVGTHDAAPLVTVTPCNGGRYLVQAGFEAPKPLRL